MREVKRRGRGLGKGCNKNPRFPDHPITKLMVGLNITQQQLAEETGYSSGYISKIRSGTFTPTKYFAFALDSFIERSVRAKEVVYAHGDDGVTSFTESAPSTAGEAMHIAIVQAVDDYLSARMHEEKAEYEVIEVERDYYKGLCENKEKEIQELKDKLMTKNHLGIANKW